ncbi:MAG: TldD/PmbA family protein [Bacteroidales bacterium]|nr:TldD/PmbA family protein [Bacteroidales bacterium]
MKPNRFLELFSVSGEQLRTLVAEGLRTGGSWCDLFFEYTVTSDLVLRDGEVNSGGSHEDFGCGIRVLSGEKTGYAYAETTAYPELLQAAKAAAAIADSSAGGSRSSETCATLGARLPSNRFYAAKIDWRETSAADGVPVLRRLDSAIRSRDSRVIRVIAMLSSQTSEIMMYNSLDELCCDTRPMGALMATVVFQQGDRIENKTVSRSFRSGAEMISDALIEELADMAVDGLDARFEARRPKGGVMPVVMAAGASGILLHEAMGHAFEADFNRKGQSVFSDKVGKRVAKKGINILDDATIPGNRGSLNFDDEGVPGQKTYMVRDGVLESYLHDRISARYYGVFPTGNGRRESFRYNPIPRMRCTYMESGTDGTLEDLIGSVRRGIFVKEFSNGQVKIGEGDFTFYVKAGWTIENGRLDMPVKDINIIGNGPRALADIEAVAGDLRIDDATWTCGKEQSAPVSCGIPSVLVCKLTVGGE